MLPTCSQKCSQSLPKWSKMTPTWHSFGAPPEKLANMRILDPQSSPGGFQMESTNYKKHQNANAKNRFKKTSNRTSKKHPKSQLESMTIRTWIPSVFRILTFRSVGVPGYPPPSENWWKSMNLLLWYVAQNLKFRQHLMLTVVHYSSKRGGWAKLLGYVYIYIYI